ncbi:glucosyltransferase [Ophidiomyces ophidiicola]|uniref:Glucosyltransferase n=1 Tax=Ophidiomyces ophidiicola TaxID=1387563 RepID=A0ACB8V4G0_9EURO|nr:glucosyltransferase [Ophidiomyces ophidiicola]KAI1939868.1 glucosyltransferase [Ophidiomyces ophidiicola]KAI1947442.1 glucosyltransferase [Ophidiomyces ophidiicola]KAI1969668.1 glucosyltransferase [Ophidiomyces ophidiicola]KAI1977277.1 glucosyltransferase [Ophidiomyces ophidiicola]KAI1984720.1 glucosyltransferase [Ophidiomyces ophidiicola]
MKQRVSSSYAASATSIALTTAVISTCILCWLDKVNRTVVDPYLDEVFHVRQSQTYWRHQWSQWDPKITTPPGLYLLSYLLGAVGFLISRKPTILSASYLRSLNGLVLFNSLPILLRNLLRSIWAVTDSSVSENSNLVPEESNWAFSLTALNICLFPPIFFFSGLYYTDLAALLIVLEVYRQDLKRPSYSKNSLWKTVFSYQTALFTLSGITSLIFRQTNIFWVAVFLGGLRVIKTIRSVHTETQVSAINAVIESSWKDRKLYDPLVSDAAFEDYFKAGVSIGIAAAANICIVLAELLPYLMVLGSFGLFVLWNGSVVLG